MRDDVLHGLGESDCKAGLAAQIYAACLLKRSLLPLRGNLIVAATVSEEQGGSLGLRHLMRDTLPSLDLRPDFAILGEPTSLSIYYGHDGSAMFEVVIEGPDRFQVTDATNAVLETFRDQYQTVSSPDELERQSLGAPRFQQTAGTASGVIPVFRRLPGCETVSGMLDQIKREARAAAESVARVAVNVQVRREERQLYTKRTTVLEQRIEAWSLDPYHPLIVRVATGIDRGRLSRVVRQVAASAVGNGHGWRSAGQRVPRAGHRLWPWLGGYLPRAQRIGFGARFQPGHLRHGGHYACTGRRAGVRLDSRRDLAMNVLVFNCGSSSLKYRLLSMPAERELSGGEGSDWSPHCQALVPGAAARRRARKRAWSPCVTTVRRCGKWCGNCRPRQEPCRT